MALEKKSASAAQGHLQPVDTGAAALLCRWVNVSSLRHSSLCCLFTLPTFDHSVTALLQMPHMKTSIPEFLDPRVRYPWQSSCVARAPAMIRAIPSPIFCPQIANEPVQCAQKTEKGLSGYAYNKQTGLVNKVCSFQFVDATACLFRADRDVVLEKALVRAGGLSTDDVHPTSLGEFPDPLETLFVPTFTRARAQGELQPKVEINVAGCSLGKQYKCAGCL